jgi:hypothetical protein
MSQYSLKWILDRLSRGLKVVKVMDKEGDGSWIFILERKRKLMENLKYGDKGKSKAMDHGFFYKRERCLIKRLWILDLPERTSC